MSLDEEYEQLCKGQEVTVRFLFHVKNAANIKSPSVDGDLNTYINIETIKDFTRKREISLPEMVGTSIPVLNKELPNFLKSKSIKHFLPYRPISVEIKENIVEICYHFDKEYYDFVYNSCPGYVMAPLVVPPKLEELFHMHGMDRGWYDKACFVAGEDEEDE
jgi:hypothetical protein